MLDILGLILVLIIIAVIVASPLYDKLFGGIGDTKDE